MLSLIVSAGHRGDSPQFIPVLRRVRVNRLIVGRARSRPVSVLADKAYISRGNRRYLRSCGIRACNTDQDTHRKAKGASGVDPSSTRSSSGYVTPSRTVSLVSNAIVASPLVTTSWPSASEPS